MKALSVALVVGLAAAQDTLKVEVEQAFVHMDLDLDGIVTKHEILQSIMKDTHSHRMNDTHVNDIVHAVDKMIEKHDRNHNGFDFFEMYTASGGKLSDLWIFNHFHILLFTLIPSSP